MKCAIHDSIVDFWKLLIYCGWCYCCCCCCYRSCCFDPSIKINIFHSDVFSHFFSPSSFILSTIKPFITLLQAFYNEVKCIFRNRLTAEVHKNQFDTILSSACRNLFDIDESNHFFVPSGNQSTALQYTTQQDWTDIVKRNITICSMWKIK